MLLVRHGWLSKAACLQENVCPDHLLTDRAAYISYLESQLEHVTSACMTVASFEERLEAATASTRAMTMKVCLLTLPNDHHVSFFMHARFKKRSEMHHPPKNF